MPPAPAPGRNRRDQVLGTEHPNPGGLRLRVLVFILFGPPLIHNVLRNPIAPSNRSVRFPDCFGRLTGTGFCMGFGSGSRPGEVE